MQGTSRLGCLDGLRGLAALWVLVGHGLQGAGLMVPLLGAPSYGVDLFMLLSGFLMMYHATLREPYEPMHRPFTWLTFWARRWFRIAPVYYLLLPLALALGPWLAASWQTVHGGERVFRLLDGGFDNLLAHLSFWFGFSPYYHQRTAMPDWSLGLEMAFYLVFPFLFLLFRRVGPWAASGLLIGLCGLAWLAVPDYMGAFHMPSFLLLKLNIFLAGMVLGVAWFGRRQGYVYGLLGLATLLSTVPLYADFGIGSAAIRIALVLGLAALTLNPHLLPTVMQAPAHVAARLLGRGAGAWLGKVSYGVYLVHGMILLPLLALFINAGWPGWAVFTAAVGLALPFSLLAGWLLHELAEQPGIALGKRAVAALRQALARRVPILAVRP